MVTVESGLLVGFPYDDSFRAVLDRNYSWDSLRSHVEALRRLIQALSDLLGDRAADGHLLRACYFSVAAQQRCQVALLFEDLIRAADTEEMRDELVRDMCTTWERSVVEDSLILVSCNTSVAMIVRQGCEDMWRFSSLRAVMTGQDLLSNMHWCITDVKFVRVNEVLVENSKGRKLSDMSECDLVCPALTHSAYADMLKCISSDCVTVVEAGQRAIRPLADVKGGSAIVGEESLPDSVFKDWLWLLRDTAVYNEGACYLRVFHPGMRRQLYETIGTKPTYRVVLNLVTLHGPWAGHLAEVSNDGKLMHASTCGDLPLVDCPDDVVFGAPSGDDAFARALVDSFISKHTEKTVSPASPSFAADLSLPIATSQADRSRVEISDVLHKSAGVLLSPRSRNAPPSYKYYSKNKVIDQRDLDRMAVLSSRMAGGGPINESYFMHLQSRIRRKLRSPRIGDEHGYAVHVFRAFQSSEESDNDGWQLDRTWPLDGWESYVYQVPPYSRKQVVFRSAADVQDIRMDATGDMLIQFNGMSIIGGTSTVWFTQSVRFVAQTREVSGYLRVSVPDHAVASVVGSSLTRYLRLPGYSYVHKSYGVDIEYSGTTITMQRQRHVNTFVDMCTGQASCAVGKNRFVLSAMRSNAAVKMILATKPLSALLSVTVGAVTYEPRHREFISIIMERQDCNFVVEVKQETSLRVSVAQIVDETLFDRV